MDNMPPLPLMYWRPAGYWFSADQMHAYARAYAEQRCAPLVEALRFYASSCDATETTPCGYEGNLCCKRARAALAAQEKQHG